ncbi:MAG: DUF5615 family PIN-like protein [Caldilineaceae bacterium]
MNVLLDMPVSPNLVHVLEEYGHVAVHASDLGLFRATDQELMELARQTDRIIITADLDFPQLLALSGAASPGLILFRGGDYSEREMEELLRRVLDSIPADRIQSAICVVDRKRIRVTELPLGRN